MRESLIFTLRLLVRPVVRFSLRRSLKIQEVLEAVKQVFIEVAQEEAKSCGQELNVSRLSIMTGMHRRDVSRLLNAASPGREPENLMARIIGQWRNDPRFLTKSKKPRSLQVEGKKSEFTKLVSSVSKDLNPYTVLFELERLEYVSKSQGKVRLLAQMHISKGDLQESFSLLSSDCEDLLAAVEENIFREPHIPNLHLKTHYDNVLREALPEIRKWLLRKGTTFHQDVSTYLSKFDVDVNAKLKGKAGCRVALGSFSLTEVSERVDGVNNNRSQ